MKVVRVRADGTIKLPKEVLRLFPPASVVRASREGNTVVLRRSTVLQSSRVKPRSSTKTMSIEEAAEETHDIRREKRGRST